MSSVQNALVHSQNWPRFRWQNIMRKSKFIPRLNSCFYFFNLEKGCKFIAIFEALASVVQICSIYYLVNQASQSATFSDPLWVTKLDRDGIIRRFFLHRTNHNFRMGLGWVTVLNSMLLFIGSKWGHQVFLFLWIYISVFTALMTNVSYILRYIGLTQFLISLSSITLETYFIMVVVSLICKFQEKSTDRSAPSDVEVLLSDSEEL
ncbi:uncharacterized protein LOC108039824 [Drosophila rhopaloa]|uniref:Uncharacterized protein LOC108039824 n=1 Tax=Drosophila rhopaloa TaxID=1041015 RepID=A0A6P4EGK5_DRORH|nr:uncharacterized protein LOC108039824 [Drosophila rhopaloa]